MPSPATLELIADLLVKRIVDEFREGGSDTLQMALDRAFPFDGVPEGEAIWRKAAGRVLEHAPRRPSNFRRAS